MIISVTKLKVKLNVRRLGNLTLNCYGGSMIPVRVNSTAVVEFLRFNLKYV